MKRFFPSSVMLIPFVVKHYPDQEEFSSDEVKLSSHAQSPVVQNHLTDTPKAQEKSVEG
ncbi:hypothetical protein DU972_002635 [Vibrio mimicus]